jgi:lipid A 3-O-deacylase
MRFIPALAAAAVSCLTIAMLDISSAQAQSARTADASGFAATDFPHIDEVRLGAFYHQLNDTAGERGADINMEILFGKLGAPRGDYLLDYFLRPRVHIGASINTNGDTSQVYGGLTWDMPLIDRFFLETSFGGSLNDGYTDREAGHTALGCHENFRESASLGYHLSERWDVLATVDHMSNAGLCEFNAGITDAGLRFGYKW